MSDPYKVFPIRRLNYAEYVKRHFLEHAGPQNTWTDEQREAWAVLEREARAAYEHYRDGVLVFPLSAHGALGRQDGTPAER